MLQNLPSCAVLIINHVTLKIIKRAIPVVSGKTYLQMHVLQKTTEISKIKRKVNSCPKKKIQKGKFMKHVMLLIYFRGDLVVGPL